MLAVAKQLEGKWGWTEAGGGDNDHHPAPPSNASLGCMKAQRKADLHDALGSGRRQNALIPGMEPEHQP